MMASKESKHIAAIAAYCGVCGQYIIAKDYKTSIEHRMSINDHIKAKHKDAKLNLWRPVQREEFDERSVCRRFRNRDSCQVVASRGEKDGLEGNQRNIGTMVGRHGFSRLHASSIGICDKSRRAGAPFPLSNIRSSCNSADISCWHFRPNPGWMSHPRL
jgi:hypothetical protein